MSDTQLTDLLGAEFLEPTEVRVQKGLTSPGSPGGMQLGAINKITQARIRWALAELTGLQLDKVSGWFDQLAEQSPKAAIELLVELLKFTTPQQKQMTVESATPQGENMGALSLSQLQGLVFRSAADDAAVVSKQ
jgi:hypothetical protein